MNAILTGGRSSNAVLAASLSGVWAYLVASSYSLRADGIGG